MAMAFTREIPPGEILREAAHKGHRRRVAAVQVLPVGAVGGDLGLGAVLKHRDGAVADPGGDGLGKERRNLLGQCGGGDIPVVDGTPQQRIPHNRYTYSPPPAGGGECFSVPVRPW